MTTPWGIHHLENMLGTKNAQAGLPDGRYVRAVPVPYPGTLLERVRAAWWVFTERAYAVKWPESGDLESHIHKTGGL